VAHVGDEVPPHTLDPPELRDVADEGNRPDHPVTAPQGRRAHEQHLARRTEELELPLGTLAPQRRCEQRAHRVLDEGVRVAGTAEALAGGVAHDLVAPGVHDDHAVLERRYGPGQRLALDVASRATALPVERLVQLSLQAAELAPL
jgi:hypothetical protein